MDGWGWGWGWGGRGKGTDVMQRWEGGGGVSGQDRCVSDRNDGAPTF